MDDLKQAHSNHLLLSLGKVASLRQHVNTVNLNEKIKAFEEHFKYYNPRKKGYNRYGLSLTSKDGGFSGIPDLDSLLEYNRENGTNLNETDFRKRTPFFKACEELQKIMQPFHEFIGRSHILRLNKGGFFPFHRDGMDFVPKSFRLFISLSSCNQFVFLLDDERMLFEPGRLYFINTQLVHCLFSFEDKSDFVVFNIDLSEKSVKTVVNNLELI